MNTTIGISLLGCGTVGTAVARLLFERRQALEARCGLVLNLRHILVRDPDKKRASDLPAGLLTTDRDLIFTDHATQIIVELIGGLDPAKDLILRALTSGRDVVTANKALLASHGPEMFTAARENDRCIAYEASVGGGIPLLESIQRGLIANEIDAVYGILNGTCNYVLTRMLEDKVGFAEALCDAQRLGYAEADPSLDIDGTDSAHKLAILATVAMRCDCPLEEISFRGITDLEITDLLAGDELGYVCKLLAIARNHDDGLDLSVQPTFIRKSHPLASVSGPFNAVSVYGDAVGHTLFYGRGAGGRPTASAVIADVIDVATGKTGRTFSQFVGRTDSPSPSIHRSAGENESPFFIRVGLVDRPGGMAKIAAALGDQGISIASLVQHEPADRRIDDAVPVVAITRTAKQKSIQSATEAMSALDVVSGRIVCIPVLDEHVETQME